MTDPYNSLGEMDPNRSQLNEASILKVLPLFGQPDYVAPKSVRYAENEGTIGNKCPKCGASDIGGLIPQDIAHMYGGTHWQRHIALYDRDKDCTVGWRCCECGHEWGRI